MKKVKRISVLLIVLISILLVSCHAQEPYCPAYANDHQLENENV